MRPTLRQGAVVRPFRSAAIRVRRRGYVEGMSDEGIPHDDERAAREAFEREADDPDPERRSDAAQEDERISEESGGWGPPGRGTDQAQRTA